MPQYTPPPEPTVLNQAIVSTQQSSLTPAFTLDKQKKASASANRFTKLQVPDASTLGAPLSIGQPLSPKIKTNNQLIFPVHETEPLPVFAAQGTHQTRLQPQNVNLANSASRPANHWVSDSAVSNTSHQSKQQLAVPLSFAKKLQIGEQETTRLITQERKGASHSFEFSFPVSQASPAPGELAPQDSLTIPVDESVSVVEVTADRQEYNEQQQVITASGNVVMRFSQAVLTADRLQVNVPNRLAVAQGNVVLRRGDQVLRGSRFDYFFFQDNGVILNASGEAYIPTVGRDTAVTNLPTDISAGGIPAQPLDARLAEQQPLQRITTTEGYQFSLGNIGLSGEEGLPEPETGGTVSRLRFEAERIDFDAEGWQASNVRLTNDPFSPPELEVRADTATYRNIAPLVDEIVLTDSQVVLDQGLTVPLFRNRFVIDRRPRDPGIFSIGFDGDERGGLFIERSFSLINTERVNFSVTPQYLLQRALFPGLFDLSDEEENGNVIGPSSYGVGTNLEVTFSPRTTFLGTTALTSLDLSDLADDARVKLRLQQLVGDLNRPHALSFEFNYRERVFNGSLGLERVQSSIGAVLTSPVIALGNTGIDLSYQASIQNISARTDRDELEEDGNDIINLNRYQGAASLGKGFFLWQGQALPPTPEAGLRYSPVPVQPFIQLRTGLTGVFSYYSNGDTQPSLGATIGIEGQFGQFSRPFFDYTGFNVGYTQGIGSDESPFRFDRFVDQSRLSLGITQQIYGPVRAGVQASFSLDEDDEISTDYFLEYSRRTYNILVRYNPVLQIGSINLRVNDFNWNGNAEPFDGSGIQPVVQGVTR